MTLIKQLLSFPSCKTQTTSMLRFVATLSSLFLMSILQNLALDSYLRVTGLPCRRELPVLDRNAAPKMLFQSKLNKDRRRSQQVTLILLR